MRDSIRPWLLLAALALAGCDASDAPAAAAARNDAFDQHCISCHGPDARGIDNLGVDLVASDFVRKSSEAALVEFLKLGRLADDPGTRSGQLMPGFGWVAEGELVSLAAFLKSLHDGG